jgi:hypothetical protein
MNIKSKAIAFISGAAIVSTLAFTSVTTENHLARPKQVEGLYVYVMSEPADEYYKLGQVGSGTVTKWDAMIKQVVKNVKTTYPDADGVIFDEVKSVGYGIQFKKK